MAERNQNDGLLDLSKISPILGDKTPALNFGPVGRIRLIRALKNTFGDSFKSFPNAREALRDFDQQRGFVRSGLMAMEGQNPRLMAQVEEETNLGEGAFNG